MKLLLTKITPVILICTVSCGFGYIGDLPDVSQNFVDEKKQNDAKRIESIKNLNQKLEQIKNDDLHPLAPSDIPDIYSITVTKRGSYSEYKQELDSIIPLLEKLKVSIDKNEGIQKFNAKAKNLDFHVKYFTEKFNKKPEKFYDSYKALSQLNSQAQLLSFYWVKSNQNNRFISNYESNGAYAQESILEQIDTLHNKICDVINMLKESSY